MTSLRILHIDDEPDIREVVELSLGLDLAFSVRSCASGPEALATAAVWSPDMILCDVMMPVMDGPATLARLRECPQTVNTPVVFMTARAQTRELEHFKSLGAIGVIAKPFDPMTLADSVRGHLRLAGFAALRGRFVKRMRADAATLTQCRASLHDEPSSPRALEQIKAFAHALVGSGGIFGFEEVSNAASVLETTAIDQLAGDRTPGKVEGDLDVLLDCIEHAQSAVRPSRYVADAKTQFDL
jgi:CheY-like chemotaxis protein